MHVPLSVKIITEVSAYLEVAALLHPSKYSTLTT
jgi:hypothetical protein